MSKNGSKDLARKDEDKDESATTSAAKDSAKKSTKDLEKDSDKGSDKKRSAKKSSKKSKESTKGSDDSKKSAGKKKSAKDAEREQALTKRARKADRKTLQLDSKSSDSLKAKVAKKELERRKASRTPHKVKNISSPAWYAPTMCTIMCLGLAWVVVSYMTGGEYPVPWFIKAHPADWLANGNVYVGFVLMLAGFIGILRRKQSHWVRHKNLKLFSGPYLAALAP